MVILTDNHYPAQADKAISLPACAGREIVPADPHVKDIVLEWGGFTPPNKHLFLFLVE